MCVVMVVDPLWAAFERRFTVERMIRDYARIYQVRLASISLYLIRAKHLAPRVPDDRGCDMPETLKPAANAPQIEHCNAVAGKTGAQHQELLDRQIESLGLAAIDALAPTKGEHILDIGCGCGQSSLALADRAGLGAP